jgi:hypothetical protein
MTTKDAAVKWGVTPRQVQLLCSQGRIPGAARFGHAWVIPVDAEKPEDKRSKKRKEDEGDCCDYR